MTRNQGETRLVQACGRPHLVDTIASQGTDKRMKRLRSPKLYLVIAALLCVSPACKSDRGLISDRRALGPIEESGRIGLPAILRLEPVEQTQEHDGVVVSVKHADETFLTELFSDQEIFGKAVGENPFWSEHLVFYVEVSNGTGQRVQVNPATFIVVDDRGNQYSALSAESVAALEEYHRSSISSTTRSVADDVEPGYFGVKIPVGRFLVRESKRLALIKRTGLLSGVLYPEVAHSGLLAFWTPSTRAKKLRLIMSDIRKVGPNGTPQECFEVQFEFTIRPRTLVAFRPD